MGEMTYTVSGGTLNPTQPIVGENNARGVYIRLVQSKIFLVVLSINKSRNAEQNIKRIKSYQKYRFNRILSQVIVFKLSYLEWTEYLTDRLTDADNNGKCDISSRNLWFLAQYPISVQDSRHVT